MNNRERVLAIVGAMQCVSDMVQSAYQLYPNPDTKTANNRCRAAVIVAVSWALDGGTSRECAARNAAVVISAVDDLPETIDHNGAAKYLKAARQSAHELKAMTG